MRVPIVDIGNSKGIRIPQAILKQVQFSEEIELDVSEGKITLRRIRRSLLRSRLRVDREAGRRRHPADPQEDRPAPT